MTLLYVAAPIDQATPGIWTATRDILRSTIGALDGVTAFYPHTAFTVGPNTMPNKGLEKANRAVLAVSDGLVALLPEGVASVGVPREIEGAVAAGIPVAVITDNSHSWSLADVPWFPLGVVGVRAAVEYVRTSAVQVKTRHMTFHIVGSGKMPTRAYGTDAGYDLTVSRSVDVAPGEFVDVHTDVRVALTPDLWARIVGRSSTRRRRNLLVVEGIIDPGYRGELCVGVQNMGHQPIRVDEGERLAQLIPHRNLAIEVTTDDVNRRTFDALPHDGRGVSGFGSSGA